MPSRHARFPRGADPRRDAGGLRVAAHDDRRAVRHRRGVRQQVAVPALHRARHPPVQPHRRLQCRRPHRGDEGRRLERGALRRHDAAQSARADLHRGDGAFLPPRSPTSPGSKRAPRRPRSSASTIPTSSRCSRGSKAPTIRSATRPASASRSTKQLIQAAELQVLGSAAPEAPRRLGHQLVVPFQPECNNDAYSRHHAAAQGPDRRAQGDRRRDRRRHARPYGLPQPAHGRSGGAEPRASRSSGRR